MSDLNAQTQLQLSGDFEPGTAMALVSKVWQPVSDESESFDALHESRLGSNPLESAGRNSIGSSMNDQPEHTGDKEAIPSDASHQTIAWQIPHENCASGTAGEGATVSDIAKRTIDILGSSTLLVVLLPILIGIGLIVLSDGGHAIFGHQRIGRGGRTFRCLKFRSMINNADAVLTDFLAKNPQAREEWNRDFKLRNDIRITPIGRILRRTSLDELPQLWNVLRGDMSLVGPRPVVDKELPRYGQDARYYLMVKPGMTGLWQVSGRNDVDYATRVSLDVSYVKERSVLLDVSILLRTFKVVFEKDGAY
nr:sugar transferase [Caballeronia catudaia]